MASVIDLHFSKRHSTTLTLRRFPAATWCGSRTAISSTLLFSGALRCAVVRSVFKVHCMGVNR